MMEAGKLGSDGQFVVDAIRPQVKALEPYSPIVPLEVLAARLRRDPTTIVKLDANENLYGPSPQVRKALAEIESPHIYPDPDNHSLRSEIAGYYGVPAENLFAGSGADELIDLIMRLFLEPGDGIIDCPPTFGMYTFDAAIHGAQVISVPRKADFSLDVDAIEAAVANKNPKLLFLTSPNNPDGSIVSDRDLFHLLTLPVVLVLDEAYSEFAAAGTSRLRLTLEYPNLIVLRTFSKGAGLAGLRVGWGAFPTKLLTYMWKIKQPYNVSVAATAAAVASLRDRERLRDVVARIVHERERLYGLLGEIPYLSPYPSQANFVLCRVDRHPARDLKRTLEEYGIMVRYFNNPILERHIRVSVGKPEHTDALLNVLRQFA